jgi:hypothetical protein
LFAFDIPLNDMPFPQMNDPTFPGGWGLPQGPNPEPRMPLSRKPRIPLN